MTARRLMLAFVLFLLLLSGHLGAQEPAAKVQEPFRKLSSGDGPLSKDIAVYDLPNGLRVLLLERHRAPVVTFMVWYKVGSVNEITGKTGLSHFLEHMMFKGTAKYKPGEIDLLTMRAGGSNNAATSYDYTCYYFDLASDRWELALQVESDRMQNAGFTAEQFESERQVVISELDGGMDSPWERLYIETHAVSYLAHPYRNPIIGHKSDIKAVSRDDMIRHYKTYYAPNNATVVVVGDFDAGKAIVKIADALGGIPRGPEVPAVVTQEPGQKGQRRVEVVEDTSAARVEMLFHTVPISHDDDVVLEVIATCLSRGKSSRLYRKLVDQEKIATGVWAWEDSRRYAGQFTVSAELRPEKDPAAAEKLIFEELTGVAKEGLSEKELARARNTISADFVFDHEKVSDLAYDIGYYETVDSYKKLDTFLEKLAQVKVDDVKRVAGQYFTRENSAIGFSVPRKSEEAAPKQGRLPVTGRKEAARRPRRFGTACQQAPAPAPTGANPLEAESQKLPNGTLVFLREDHTVPALTLRAWVEAGTAFNPPGKDGLSNIVGQMLAEGTKKRTHEQIADDIDFVGGRLANTGSGLDVSVLSKDIELAFDLSSDMLAHSAFPTERFEFQKQRILSEIRASKDEPRYKAQLAFLDMVYGKHPYHAPPEGLEESVQSITIDEALAFYKKFYVPSNTIISVVGDFKTEQVKALLEKYFADWKGPQAPLTQIPDVLYQNSRTRVIDAETEQAYIYMGHRGILRTNPDYYSLLVTDYILGTGPGFTSRIIKRLREKEGLAYEVWAYCAESSGLEPGRLTAYAGCAAENARKMITGLTEEIERIRQKQVSDEELADAKKYLTGAFVFYYQTNAQIANELVHTHRYKLGSDYVSRYPGLIEAVTAEKVLDIARKYLRPESLQVAICGPAAKIGEGKDK